jgi:hypothetical protein
LGSRAARPRPRAGRPPPCGRLARRWRGLGEIGRATLDPAPETPLNVDIALAVVAGALQKWLRSRGMPTHGLELRALVAVSGSRHHPRRIQRLVFVAAEAHRVRRDPSSPIRPTFSLRCCCALSARVAGARAGGWDSPKRERLALCAQRRS